MRGFSFTHTVLASLLWCAAVFIFVGINFVRYESAFRTLRISRIEERLLSLQKTLQLEMDKGYSLNELKTAEKFLLQYGQEEKDFSSAQIIDAKNGNILFGTSPAQTVQNASSEWRTGCLTPDTVFTEEKENSDIFGVPLFNALLDNVGCLTVSYSKKTGKTVRDQMIKTALHHVFRLSAIGVSAAFLLYLFFFLTASLPTGKKKQAFAVLVVLQGLLLFFLCRNVSAMFKAFEADLRQEIAVKSGLIASRIARQLENTVQSGVPFDSVTGLEAYMEQIRQKNKEILFVLITDKTGRVLYEAGSAANAFEADARTGKISLKKGYYNAAEPVNGINATIGWIQIGVNERFVREKIF